MKAKESKWDKIHKRETFLALLIVTLPFLIYLHLIFDKENAEFIRVFGLSIRHGFSSTQLLVWYVLGKLIPLVLCIIWLFTSNNRSRHYILIPICIYFFQLMKTSFNIFFDLEVYRYAFSIFSSLGFLILLSLLDKTSIRCRDESLGRLGIKIKNNRQLFYQIHGQLLNVKTKKNTLATREYSIRLQYIQDLINECINVDNKKIVELPKSDITSSIAIIVLCLIMFPLFYFSHFLIPKGLVEIQVLWFTIHDYGFVDVNIFYWYIMLKFNILILLTGWFLTCNSWWRYALFSPIILFTFQIWEAFQDIHQLDAYGNIKAFPAVFTVVLVIIVLSKMSKAKYGLFKLRDIIVRELDVILRCAAKENLKETSEYRKFKRLKRKHTRDIDEPEYLSDLFEVRDQLKYRINSLK